MKGTKRWIVIVVASMLVLLTLFGILLWRLGLFDFTGADASAKIIAATLALIGGLIGSVVTVVGIFLKHSLDQRNADLRDDAEKRLKNEAAIQAVQLLSTSSGKDVPMTQRAGVLFTLADLGQEGLAINMASQMIGDDKIDTKTVDWLIDRALKSNDEVTQEEACSLLDSVANTMFIKEGESSRFPPCLLEWNRELTPMVRRRGLHALLRQMLSRPYSKWKEGYIRAVIMCLASYWRNEEDERLKNSAGLCLEKILNVFKVAEDEDFIASDGTLIGIHKIKTEVRGLNTKMLSLWNPFITFSEQIDKWGST